MRLILTLLPATSFLVPLDKCLQFSLEAVAGKGKGAPLNAAATIQCLEFWVGFPFRGRVRVGTRA